MSQAAGAMPEGYAIYDPIDPFENNAGPFYAKRDDNGGLEFAILTGPEHCNTHGVIHGGLMMTMADLTICVTARQGTEDTHVLTVSLNSDFVNGGYAGDLLRCKANVVRRTGSLAFVDAKVYTDENVLLNCSAVVKRMRKKS